jgi:hypothetical protein
VPIKLSCQNCKQELSEQEVKANKCCPKCGSWLKVNRAIMSEPHEKPESKIAFVRMLYSNVKKQQGSPCQECDECFQKIFKKALKEQLKAYPDSELASFTAKPCFPPIGSAAKGQILFIGTNPRLRVGSEDEDFYLGPMTDEDSFLRFSKKGDYEYDGFKRNLLAIPHYKIHRLAMKQIGLKLGEDSSIAELFMCASHKSNTLYDAWGGLIDCTCANLYLLDYMKITKPRLIVCLGSPASQWFLKRFGEGMKNKKLSAGSPIEELNAEYSKVQLTPSFTTTVLFTIHPNNHCPDKTWLQIQFLGRFKRLAKRKEAK